MIKNFLLALMITEAVEVCTAYALGYRDRKSLIAVFLVNLITNPILNYIFLIITVFRSVPIHTLFVLLAELPVVLAEWRMMAFALERSPKQLFILSLLMNAASYLAGLLFFRLIV